MSNTLTWMPAWEIRELIAKGEVSATEVTDHFLSRIEEHGATLKAFLSVDVDGARAQAKRAERAVAAGDPLGPLHGIPVSVKAHIAVEGFAAAGKPARHDHVAVARLRQAGAVIVGHNTMMGSGAGPGGYNWEVEARNPWDPSRVPGWSSSGGAASAVSRLVPVALGSDGGGSTRLPAAYSGVVGVHPTVGLIPWVDYSRQAPPATSTVGPLARNVVDAAIALQAMAGPDGRDFVGIPFELPPVTEQIDAGVEGMNLAWTDDYGFTSAYAVQESVAVIAHARQAAQRLTSLGATVSATDERWEDFWPSLAITHAVYGPMGILGAETAKATPAEAWESALDLRARNWQRFHRLFDDHDLLLSVTSQILAPKVETWDAWWTKEGARFAHGSFAPAYCSHTWMFNWLAFPAVSVPCGFVDGLPVGLQIVGPPGSEAKIFRVANAYQQAFPQDERPQIS